jgi:hypothetical protein
MKGENEGLKEILLHCERLDRGGSWIEEVGRKRVKQRRHSVEEPWYREKAVRATS